MMGDAEVTLGKVMDRVRSKNPSQESKECISHRLSCKGAAADRDLEALQWAKPRGCNWHKETCAAAAAHGQLEFLQ